MKTLADIFAKSRKKASRMLMPEPMTPRKEPKIKSSRPKVKKLGHKRAFA